MDLTPESAVRKFISLVNQNKPFKTLLAIARFLTVSDVREKLPVLLLNLIDVVRLQHMQVVLPFHPKY